MFLDYFKHRHESLLRLPGHGHLGSADALRCPARDRGHPVEKSGRVNGGPGAGQNARGVGMKRKRILSTFATFDAGPKPRRASTSRGISRCLAARSLLRFVDAIVTEAHNCRVASLTHEPLPLEPYRLRQILVRQIVAGKMGLPFPVSSISSRTLW